MRLFTLIDIAIFAITIIRPGQPVHDGRRRRTIGVCVGGIV